MKKLWNTCRMWFYVNVTPGEQVILLIALVILGSIWLIYDVSK